MPAYTLADVVEGDPIFEAAKHLAAELHAQSPEVQQAFRYLYARVALDT
jgi:hypothetical protein